MAFWLVTVVHCEGMHFEWLEQVRDELGHVARQYEAQVRERPVFDEEGKLLLVEFLSNSDAVVVAWRGRYPLGISFPRGTARGEP